MSTNNIRSPLSSLSPKTSAAAAALSLCLCLPNAGCLALLGGGDADFIEDEDVRLAVPAAVSQRAGDPDLIVGDLYRVVTATIEDTNGWVTSSVEGIASIYRFLDRRRETSRDGSWRVYGPHPDDDGRDLAWLVKIDEPAGVKTFEFYVGPRSASGQAEMDLFVEGSLKVEGDVRSGGYNLHFDAIEAHPAIKAEEDSQFTFAGSIMVSFERDTATEAKSIDVDFIGFSAHYDGFLDEDSFSSDESYNFKQNADGSGDFHLALMGPWDDHGWSGPENERLALDMAWTPEGAGRARGQILEVDGVGDLKHGDLVIDECFKPEGFVAWRMLSAAYQVEAPEYGMGEEAACALGAEAVGK
ncbi:MAG: hypothetical protein IPK80_04795 [Nannocystis sp.]|nr:hypothetical protein [Nannocystis sp.]